MITLRPHSRCASHAPVLLAAALGLAAALLGAPARAESGMAAPLGAHVHGQAQLDIAVDGGTLTLALESPLDSLLGFERAPRDATERDAVRRLGVTLRTADAVFRPTPAAGCTLAATTLSSAALPAELLGGPAAPAAAAAPTEPGHADLDAEWRWTCRQPAALQGGELRLFDAFPNLRRVDVQIAGPRGQSAQALTRERRELRW